MWNDEEGGEPEYDLPAFEMWDQPHWVNWKIDALGELACHPQEVVDNMVDKGHLAPVHGSMDMVLFENVFDNHEIRQILTAGHKTLAGTGGEPMTNDTWYTGPGILQSVMVGEFPSHMLIAHTPVEDGKINGVACLDGLGCQWKTLLKKTLRWRGGIRQQALALSLRILKFGRIRRLVLAR